MRRFVPFLLLLLVVAVFVRADFYFTIIYLFFAVYFLSRFWLQQVTDAVQATREFEKRAFLGDQVPVTLTLRNEGRLPISWLDVDEALPIQLSTPPFYRRVITLEPRETQTFHYTLHCRQRGYYEIGPLRLRTGDLLGIQEDRRTKIESDYLVVYPRVVPIERLNLPTHSPMVALPARLPLFTDPTRVMGVRDYQQGDSPRRIHWTATASTGRLLVKQFQPAVARETLIIVDFNEESYERGHRYTATELAITAAASLCNHIIVREGQPAGLVVEGVDPLHDQTTRFALPPRSERAHLTDVLEVLARVRVGSSTPIMEILRQERARLSWGTTVLLVGGTATPEVLTALFEFRRSGFPVVLIIVQPQHLTPAAREQAAAFGIPLYRLWDEGDLGILQ